LVPKKNERDIWAKACIYEYDYVHIAADVEKGGSTFDRVALEYFRAKEEGGYNHERALEIARAYANIYDRRLSEEDILKRVERAQMAMSQAPV
jgi:hypothetical protein